MKGSLSGPIIAFLIYQRLYLYYPSPLSLSFFFTILDTLRSPDAGKLSGSLMSGAYISYAHVNNSTVCVFRIGSFGFNGWLSGFDGWWVAETTSAARPDEPFQRCTVAAHPDRACASGEPPRLKHRTNWML